MGLLSQYWRPYHAVHYSRCAGAVLAHRVQLTAQARYGGTRSDAVIARILAAVKVPT